MGPSIAYSTNLAIASCGQQFPSASFPKNRNNCFRSHHRMDPRRPMLQHRWRHQLETSRLLALGWSLAASHTESCLGVYYCPSTISGIVASRRARNWQNFHHQLRRRPLALLSAFFHPAGCFHSSGRTSSRRTNSARRFGLTF